MQVFTLTTLLDVNTYDIQIPFLITTIFLMYYFYKAWTTDPGIIKSSRDDKVKVQTSV